MPRSGDAPPGRVRISPGWLGCATQGTREVGCWIVGNGIRPGCAFLRQEYRGQRLVSVSDHQRPETTRLPGVVPVLSYSLSSELRQCALKRGASCARLRFKAAIKSMT